MTKTDMAELELYLKEQRIAYWESHHRVPGCKEMTEYFDTLPMI